MVGSLKWLRWRCSSTNQAALTGVVERESIRTKGGESFGFSIVSPDGSIRGDQDSGYAKPFDQLQWRVRVDSTKHVAVFSRDPEGKGNIYFPANGAETLVEAGAETVLPVATELDETLGTEEITALICDKLPDLEAVRKNVEENRAPVQAASGCDVRQFNFLRSKNEESLRQTTVLSVVMLIRGHWHRGSRATSVRRDRGQQHRRVGQVPLRYAESDARKNGQGVAQKSVV
ncbi:MAG: hypothetical protein R3A47_03765 [Polyangiales bacterium]